MFERAIVGYASALSAAPGDTVEFKISSDNAGRYQADLVRVLGGDDPGGAGFAEEVVQSDFAGEYRARTQALHAGSYASIPAHEQLQLGGEFALHAVVFPTTPLKGQQALLGNFNEESRSGASLVLDTNGSPGLLIGNGHIRCVSSGKALEAGRWYAVSASYDPEIGRVEILQCPLGSGLAGAWPTRTARTFTDDVDGPTLSTSPFMCAAWTRDEAGHQGGHYNGKIDAARVLNRAISAEDLPALRAVAPNESLADGVVAWWDFSRGINTEDLFDCSHNGLHGQTHELPARGMTGWNWSGEEHCWQSAPEHYGAIHFHDDDLVDASWDTDFSFTVPEDLPSGVYAARIRQGDPQGDEHVVFFVRPARASSYSRAAVDVAFLVPTASYLAYANYRLRLKPNPLFGSGEPNNPYDAYLKARPELGASLYDVHNDWSGVHISSRHRPLTNLRPRQNRIWGFPADMNIVAWLEQSGVNYEVITDEDLHDEGEPLLSRYRTVITGSHPEYYSTRMLDSVESYLGGGGRLMYMGGNGFYWRIAFHSTIPGVIEVRRAEDGTRAWIAEPGQYFQSFNGEYGGLWRRIGRPPNTTVGVGFAAQGFEHSAPYNRGPGADNPRARFAFEGVPDQVIGDFGSLGGGASGEEIDRYDIRLGSPRHALVLASATDHDSAMLRTKEEFLSIVPPFQDAKIRSDLVFFECPNGGAVFATGSIAWAGSLAHNNFENNVAQVTENVLRRFIDPTPFPAPKELST
ncbi:MAG: N,N-dimethylformamidase [Gammaproteobacteria bacterium]|jgi:N,N-dimethylformamidase